MKQRTIYVSQSFPGASINAKTHYCIAAGLRAGRDGIDLEQEPETEDYIRASRIRIKSVKLVSDDEAEVVIEGPDDLMDEYERALRIIE